MNNSDFTRDLMLTVVYNEAGIVRIDSTVHDVNRKLASLPPEEALKMKRKFRKMWRAALKRELAKAKKASDHIALMRRAGKGMVPDKRQRTNRKALVATEMRLAAMRLLGKAASSMGGPIP